MISQLTGQGLALVGLAILGLILSRLIRIEKTLCCLGVGFVAGLLVGPLGLDTGIRAGSVQDLVFYLLLPPLLFQAAWHIAPSMLRRWLIPIVTFATLGVAINGANEFSSAEIAGNILTHILGGMMVGLMLGLVAAVLVVFLKSLVIANLILVASAFGSFYVSAELLGLSGIVSVVSTALVARSVLRKLEQQFLHETEVTWSWLGETFIALIFTLMGLVIVPSMFLDQWLAIAIAIVAALLARAATVYSCSSLSSLLMRHHTIPGSWNLVLVWGGLRGAIAVALVLTLPVQLGYWYTIQSMVFGVVLFNLLAQGTTCRSLVRNLNKEPS